MGSSSFYVCTFPPLFPPPAMLFPSLSHLSKPAKSFLSLARGHLPWGKLLNLCQACSCIYCVTSPERPRSLRCWGLSVLAISRSSSYTRPDTW